MSVRFILNISKWFAPGNKHNNVLRSQLRTYSSAPIVSVEQGKLKGSMQKLLDGGTYYSFKGIPYARPPVGKLRFKAPEPPIPWQNTYDATDHGEVCPQLDMVTTQILPGDENCLFLNVYSKNISASQPVIVFIHGGAYISGSGNSDMYGPEYLIHHDVVLVTINYRLEALGFLCLDTEEVPGNAGMKDQVAALKWVNKNICNFGGNPDNVTLMGESAGASCVTFHMVSPMSRHLFHKAIVQSGVSFNDWSIGTRPVERAFSLGKFLGKDSNCKNELLTFLQSVPAVNLAKTTLKTMNAFEKKRGLPIHFCPVVEKQFPNSEPFLNEESINLFLANKHNDVPIILGFNNGEGVPMLKHFIDKIAMFDKDLHYKVPREIADKVLDENRLREIGEKLRMFYFGGKELNKSMKKEMAMLDGDLLFIFNIIRFAHIYLSGAKSPLYLYKFAFDTDLNIMKKILGAMNFKGATHADDLFYLFSSQMTEDIVNEDANARKKIEQITKMWTNFAKTGNPTPDKSMGIEWKPFTSKYQHYLEMGDECVLKQNPEQANVEFLNKIYSEVGLPCITKSNL